MVTIVNLSNSEVLSCVADSEQVRRIAYQHGWEEWEVSWNNDFDGVTIRESVQKDKTDASKTS